MKPNLLPRSRRKTGLLVFASAACLGLVAITASAQSPTATYVWQGGSQSWSAPADWGTTDVPDSAAVAAEIDGGKTSVNSLVSVNGAYTVGALTIDAGDGIFITDGSSLTLAGSSLFTGAGTLANSGSVTFEGGTFQGALTLSGSVTLVGGGTITLIPSIMINGDNATLNNVDNTIEGSSSGAGRDGILANNLTIINGAAGVINANVSGQVLTLNPRAGTLTNSGLLVATNGGTLDLDGAYGSTFINVGAGTMQAQDGSTLLVRGSSIVGGTLSTVGTGTIQLGINSSLTNVTNAGAIVDLDTVATTLAGTVTNRGSIVCQYTLGDGGSFTLNGDVTLNGGGSVTLVDRYGFNGTGTLTNVDNTISGYGNAALGDNQIAIVNGAAGVIDANVSGQMLDVDPGTGGLTNAGLMEATNGGTLQIDGTSGQGFTNTGAGTMQAMDGSTVLVDQASITGGTLSTSGSGLIQIYRGTDASGFTNVTSTGSLFVDGTVDLTGTFTNRGSVTFGSNGGNGGITIATVGDVTLNGGGTITMSSGSAITGAGGTLTNVDNTIQGFSGLGSDQIAIVNGLGGIINANVSGQTLTVDPSEGGLTNAGLMEAANGGTLLLNFNNGQGFTNQGEYRVNDGSTITAPQGGIGNLVNGVLTGGTYRVLSTGGGATTLGFGGNGVTTNAATVVLSGVNSVFADLGALSDNRGSFSLLALRQFTTTGALSNEGNLVLDAGSTLHVAGAFTAAGANASLDITVGGSATQGAQSPGILQANGAASLAGNLAVVFAPGAALPAVGDTLTVVAASAPISGSFANAASGARLTTTDGKGSFLVSYGANSASPNAVTLSRFLLPGQTDLTSVSLVANAPTANANEGVDGTFLLTRTGDLSQDLYVTYTIKGSAANGADYLTLPTTKKIKAGNATKQIKIIPVDQSYFAGGKKTVKLTLLPESTYTVSGTPTAKVKIFYDR